MRRRTEVIKHVLRGSRWGRRAAAGGLAVGLALAALAVPGDPTSAAVQHQAMELARIMAAATRSIQAHDRSALEAEYGEVRGVVRAVRGSAQVNAPVIAQLELLRPILLAVSTGDAGTTLPDVDGALQRLGIDPGTIPVPASLQVAVAGGGTVPPLTAVDGTGGTAGADGADGADGVDQAPFATDFPTDTATADPADVLTGTPSTGASGD